MEHSDYFVYESANFNPRIKVLLFLDSAQVGLLKNVQNQFSRRLGSQEIAKTQVHIFKLRLGASIPRSVGRSVCLSVWVSSKNYKKKLQNFTKASRDVARHRMT